MSGGMSSDCKWLGYVQKSGVASSATGYILTPSSAGLLWLGVAPNPTCRRTQEQLPKVLGHSSGKASGDRVTIFFFFCV